MKSCNALTALVLALLGTTGRADDPAPVGRMTNVQAVPHGAVDGARVPPLAVGAYTDFPGYHPGFTSYRGLGFMGSCCEQTSSCAQHAWDGYCESEGGGQGELLRGWSGKLHRGLEGPICCPPACCPPVKGGGMGCSQKSCPRLPNAFMRF